MTNDLIVNKEGAITEVRANDLIVNKEGAILTRLSDETKTIETRKWIVAFTVIIAVITVVPIIPIALAFLAGAVINNIKTRNNQNGKK